jgi:hypothetical protein
MLVELSVMEQRYQAVLAVTQDGWKIVEVARKLEVSRQSVQPGSFATSKAVSRRWPTDLTDPTRVRISSRRSSRLAGQPNWGVLLRDHRL